MNIKKCTNCGIEKALTEFFLEFYKNRNKFYYRGKCKACLTLIQRENRREYRKLRYQELMAYYIERNKLNRASPKGRDAHVNQIKNYIQKFPHKQAARVKLKEALQSGVITKPDKCNYPSCLSSKLEAHHQDYSKPLFVKWLCKRHHILSDNVRVLIDKLALKPA